MTAQDRICVGAIQGAFGVKGELRIKSFCADPAAIGDYGLLTNEDATMSFDLRIVAPIKNGFSARIKGVQYKDQADALNGTTLWVARDVLPNLPDDEFYHSDLIGLDVFDTGGEKIGRVIGVHDHGAGDFLEISTPRTKSNVALLPFTKIAVPTIDLTAKRIIADPPEGVF
ncbi:UNVERIFIED_CONTAM: hypothetical protein GTU68_058701 [Idotea baltica]|nr:hypothetical protein [Idotea baltica]